MAYREGTLRNILGKDQWEMLLAGDRVATAS